MKVSLIPTHQIISNIPIPLYTSIGVLQLAAALLNHNITCDVVDLEQYHQLLHGNYEDAMDILCEVILKTEPDLVGFSTWSDNSILAIELCRKLKEHCPNIITVLGGPGSSFCAKEILERFPHVDFIIKGEGDISFPAFIQALISQSDYSHIQGLVFRKNNKIIDNGWSELVKNLDDLPLPAYHLCPPPVNGQTQYDEYYGFFLENGRGCPFACTFCSTSAYFKRKHRLKSVNRMMEEIKLVKELFHVKTVTFIQDLLVFNRKYVSALCESILEELPDINWGCYARLDTIDKPLLKEMKNAGCQTLFIGIESATPSVQKKINKHLDFTQIDDMLKTLSNLNYNVIFSFITGFQDEQKEHLKDTLNMALRIKSFSPEKFRVKSNELAPELGSKLFEFWKGKMIYDEHIHLYGMYLPADWNVPRKIIKEMPDIFPTYFRIDIDPQIRKNSLKCNYLILCIQKIMVYSLLYASETLGRDNLFHYLIQNFDKIAMPRGEKLSGANYKVMVESIADLIFPIMTNPAQQYIFKSLVGYEKAVLNLFQNQNVNSRELIQVYYNPLKLISFLQDKTSSSKDLMGLELKSQYFMLEIDKNDRALKCVNLPKELINLMD